MPLKLGHLVEMVMTLFFIFVLYRLISSGVYPGVALIAGTFAIMATVHPLAHYMVGRIFGIKFTFYFPNGPALIEPTIKTDYGSYLKAAPLKRALMHAAGPVVSTLVIIVSLAVAAVVEALEIDRRGRQSG